MFYYIHEWYKWWRSWDNGIKKDESIPELPFEEALYLKRIEKSETETTPDVLPFEVYSTGSKY
jgi:hypothetical protein